MKNTKVKNSYVLSLVLLFSIMFFLQNKTYAQRNLADSSIFTPIYGLTYKGAFPGGDLAERWGFSNTLGAEINFKLKNNLTFGFESQFIFGNIFKDSSIFDNLYNSDGFITAFTGSPADILFLQRGGNFTAQIGYVINKLGHNPNSGLWLNFGLGFMYHKISIENIYDKVDQFEDDYYKGYDKLSMGVSTKQFVGYLFQADKRFLNFYAGFEFGQGFTKNIRSYNFDTEGPENDLRLDLTYGIKVGWMVPIYQRQAKKYYFD